MSDLLRISSEYKYRDKNLKYKRNRRERGNDNNINNSGNNIRGRDIIRLTERHEQLELKFEEAGVKMWVRIHGYRGKEKVREISYSKA